MNKKAVLIVDQNSSHRSMLMKIIHPMGPAVLEAKNYNEGLAKAIDLSPDIVIAGIQMSDPEGLEFCRQLNTDISTRKIPVVLMGTHESDESISLGFKSGANAYVDKRKVKSKLSGIVTKILKNHQSKQEKIILVVDDSSSICQMLWEGLSCEGYRVMMAHNGKDALGIVKETRPDLILSDIYMPEMNGFQLCETLNSDPDLSTIPFVAMSTVDDAGNMKRMMQYGATSYIIKPFNIEQLNLLLEKIFSIQFDLRLKEKKQLSAERSLLISGITSLVTALEARDLYTRGHSERVATIVSTLVEKSGGSKAEIELARMGGKLHDIGKIGIRDNVLLKEGRLTPEEYDHIKQHPLIGTNILKSVTSVSDILPMVSSHHERIDGKGYPEGLKGDEIHLWARMTAVADTFDALTSDRPYRKGMVEEKARQIIKDVKGSQLCPDCVDLFLDVIDPLVSPIVEQIKIELSN